MTVHTVARIAGIAVCAPLVTAITLNADYRTDNIFAIPDLVGSAMILIGAALPIGRSAWLLRVGFAWMAGVVLTAAFERHADGTYAMAAGNFVIAGIFAVVAVLLARRSPSIRPPHIR